MFQRLFGNTPEEQLTYLQPRILLTALVIVVGLLAMLFGGSGDWIIVIAAYVWGWDFLKNWLPVLVRPETILYLSLIHI